MNSYRNYLLISYLLTCLKEKCLLNLFIDKDVRWNGECGALIVFVATIFIIPRLSTKLYPDCPNALLKTKLCRAIITPRSTTLQITELSEEYMLGSVDRPSLTNKRKTKSSTTA